MNEKVKDGLAAGLIGLAACAAVALTYLLAQWTCPGDLPGNSLGSTILSAIAYGVGFFGLFFCIAGAFMGKSRGKVSCIIMLCVILGIWFYMTYLYFAGPDQTLIDIDLLYNTVGVASVAALLWVFYLCAIGEHVSREELEERAKRFSLEELNKREKR